MRLIIKFRNGKCCMQNISVFMLVATQADLSMLEPNEIKNLNVKPSNLEALHLRFLKFPS